jgi:hypothetical protein
VGASYTVSDGDTLLLVGAQDDIERFLQISGDPQGASVPTASTEPPDTEG